MKDCPIYVVSLPRDSLRRSRLRQQFGDIYDRFIIVDATDASVLPDRRPAQCRCNRRRPLTIVEEACALSHREVLQRFLAGGAAACVVLEDDVEGGVAAVEKALKLMNEVPEDAFVLLGGQQGLRNRYFVYGRRLELAGGAAWQLSRIDRRFISRACCYGLTRKAAARLLEHQDRCLDRADNWRRLLRGCGAVYMTDLLAHPVDLSASHIEAGRAAVTGASSVRRIWADGVIYTIATALLKLTWPSIAKCLGFERPGNSESRKRDMGDA